MLAYLAFFPKRALSAGFFFSFLSLGTDLEVGCCGVEMIMKAKPKRRTRGVLFMMTGRG